jgi:hypothetical protein
MHQKPVDVAGRRRSCVQGQDPSIVVSHLAWYNGPSQIFTNRSSMRPDEIPRIFPSECVGLSKNLSSTTSGGLCREVSTGRKFSGSSLERPLPSCCPMGPASLLPEIVLNEKPESSVGQVAS